MRPIDIKCLMHAYCVREEFKPYSPASDGAFELLEREGLVFRNPTNDLWETTDAGDAFVKVLLATKPPTQVWIDSNGKVVR